ncbi:hypothetical protein O6P43_007080 [Quillaja saponaria]|uniref:Uncharacterized protein n=1 Tax=Quillaja saponaria TaxID=32244 RepID=A0AAD7Q9S6_QUISA|nr:hypothetical protein O6P43_007080 [Quillaja saponaria]
MQDKKIQFQSLGICQRLFSFIINNLIAASAFKRISLGHSLPPGSTKLLDGDYLDHVADRSKNPNKLDGAEILVHQAHEKPTNNLGSQIEVRFLEDDELGYWTSVDELGLDSIEDCAQAQLKKGTGISLLSSTTVSPAQETEENDQAMGSNRVPSIHEREFPLVQGSGVSSSSSKPQAQDIIGLQGIEPVITAEAQPKGPNSVKNSKNLAEGEKKIKGKNIGSDNLGTKVEKMKLPPSFGFKVIANINEKSEAFIRSRREAMKTNFTMERKN